MFIHLAVLSILFLAVVYAITNAFYKKSTYSRMTHNPLYTVLFNDGIRGEFNIYRELSIFEKKGGRLLFNVYLPYEDGTTEIDVLLLFSSGLYVFESKNYSGWIFGTAKDRNWTQTLPSGKGRSSHKERFLNPLFQNALHIRQLKAFCETEELPCHSVVVFSNGCILKSKIDAKPPEYVCQTDDVSDVIIDIHHKADVHLSEEQLQTLYDRLYPLSQCTEEEKQAHIERIKKRHPDRESK